MQRLRQLGGNLSQQQIDALYQRYGMDQPEYVRFFKWITGFVRGDFGQSFTWKEPVKNLIWERVGLTIVISTASLLFIWVVAFPIGIYSAIKQYSVGDYVFTFISFLGLGIPPFLLALVVMWLAFSQFGVSVGGLLLGLLISWPIARLHRALDDALLEITITLLTPFVVYLCAEALHVSGVLAVMAAGLYLSRQSARFFSSTNSFVKVGMNDEASAPPATKVKSVSETRLAAVKASISSLVPNASATSTWRTRPGVGSVR